MKTIIPLLLLGLWTLTGCASHYAITLNNGSRINTTSKPKLKNGIYIYRDMEGRNSYVPAGRVREIGPASRSSESTMDFKSSSK